MITKRDDGSIVDVDDRKWCYIKDTSGSPATLCTGEVFGAGEGSAEYEAKTVKRGGITCSACKAVIKEIKSIKL